MAQLKIRDLSVGDWVGIDQAELNMPSDDLATACIEKLRKPIRIKGISEDSDMVIADIEIVDEWGSIMMKCEHLRPIPITPEILEKNGWKYETHTIEDINGYDIEYKCYRHTFYRDRYRYDIVLEDSYGGYYQCTIESSIPDEDGELRFISVLCSLDFVEYLHQLQHAMRLAGVEKEIEV